MTDFLYDGPDDAPVTVALAHGAGAGMEHPFMADFASGLADHGLRVARFEFPYMARRRDDGRRRPPDRMPVLTECYLDVVRTLDADRLVIGGKSMGGRVASLIADEAGVKGLVCLGYPFHPPGKPDRLRTEHLAALATPTLIVQGERDPFGGSDEVETYDLSPAISVTWMPDGDHGFKPRKASGRTERENLDDAIAGVAAFVLAL